MFSLRNNYQQQMLELKQKRESHFAQQKKVEIKQHATQLKNSLKKLQNFSLPYVRDDQDFLTIDYLPSLERLQSILNNNYDALINTLYNSINALPDLLLGAPHYRSSFSLELIQKIKTIKTDTDQLINNSHLNYLKRS